MSNRTFPKWAATLVLVAAAGLTLTACGSDSSSGQESNSEASTAGASTVAAQASAGCSSSTSPELVAWDETKTLNVSGTKRTFTIHLPPQYDGSTPTPLVLNFHGLGSNGGQQMLVSGLTTTADSKNFIAVAPNAVGGSWKLPTDANGAFGEAEYLESLTKYLNKNYCVDTQRVYSMGMSQGSAMTFILACAPNSRIAAFGGVGATFYRSACGKSAPAPIIYFHGTADKVVPINGGKTPNTPVGPAMEAMEGWAKHNKCQGSPNEAADKDVTTFSWSECADDANIIYHRITDGGHTWPGADAAIAGFMELRLGKTTQTISATDAIWEFFEQHTLSQRTD
ncbi:MAG: PHB depolymerase family esterase [Candidatus Nanopelagicales bacterium]